MASVQQVRTRLATAHTALQTAASLMDTLTYQENSSEFEYMERELHKILGRLEALDAGLVHRIPPKQKKYPPGTMIDDATGRPINA